MVFDKTGGGVITWRELDQIMVSLGYPQINAVTLKRAGVPDIHAPSSGASGLDFANFLVLLKSEELYNILDYSFNRHNAVYNIRVLKRAVQLLVDGHLELSSIRLARMAFSLYEGELCLGIPLEERSLMSLMRLTGKVIAPKKLQEWIQKTVVDIPNRVQLYEFFDIVRIADHREQVIKAISQPSSLSISKNKVGLFDVSDNSFLLTPEQKLLKKMDDDYDAYLSLLQAQQNPTKDHLEQRRNKSGPYKSVKLLSDHQSEEGSDDETANDGKKGIGGKEIVFDHIRESLRVGASNLVQVRTHLTSHPFPPTHTTRPHSVIGYINTKGGGGLGDSKRRSSTASVGKHTFEERRSNITNSEDDERQDDERIGESERSSTVVYPTQHKIFGNLSTSNSGVITTEELFEPMLEWPSFSTRRLHIPADSSDVVNNYINNTQSYEKEINRRRVRLPSLYQLAKDSMTSMANITSLMPPLPAHHSRENLQRFKNTHSNTSNPDFIETINNLSISTEEDKQFKKTSSTIS
eukprot:TRINITY_DN4637_c0_g1_i1.p1 TRINITY_DN4637_c0_g1~~TRINITY_DN4637_c0_g1_i1.p1  ORF type:complete len:522 (+),score=87.48 TRINITY_DN4637_c0_g1_i1:130-1695(+)